MKLRTKEALRTIRTKESAINEREYAGNRLQGSEQKMIRTGMNDADRIGKWGVRQTKKTISRYRKHRMAKKAEKGKKVTEKASKTAVASFSSLLYFWNISSRLAQSLPIKLQPRSQPSFAYHSFACSGVHCVFIPALLKER